jgi:NRAMP (natural resistance-associated macrophage protein)-like metal ion transporter
MAMRQPGHRPPSAGPPQEPEAGPPGDRPPWWRKLGPGLITGAADDDPSGIGTYAQAGAQFGFSMLWTAFVSLPMMITVQMLCARIGLVTGQGLAGVLRRHYSRWILVPAMLALFVANTINVGADLGAIAYGIQVVSGWSRTVILIVVTISLLVFQVKGQYRTIAKAFKWLALSLVGYVITAFLVPIHWGNVGRSVLLPRLQLASGGLPMLVALWGTTISPYLFFWQADMEVEETIANGQKTIAERKEALVPKDVSRANIDVTIGMVASNATMFFIILTTGATLFPAGIRDIQTAEQAAEALRPLAGNLAHWLFAAGLISTGVLAVPILAGSSAYAISEAMGWPCGLNKRYAEAKGFYWILGAGMTIGLALNVIGINPMKALFWTAVINGLAAPPLLVLIMLVVADRRIMGDHVAGPTALTVGWAVTLLMGLLAAALLLSPWL